MKIHILETVKWIFYLTEEQLNKMLNISRNKENLEVCMFGSLVKISDTEYAIDGDLYTPPQFNEPAETKTVDSEFPKWAYTFSKENPDKNLYVDMHSHVNMAPNPSGFDVGYFKDMIYSTTKQKVRIIFNNKGHIRCDIIDKISKPQIVAEEVDVITKCDGFNIISTTNSYRVEITDKSKLNIVNINSDLSVVLKSKLLTVSNKEIEITPVETNFSVRRKLETSEGKMQIMSTYGTCGKQISMPNLPTSNKVISTKAAAKQARRFYDQQQSKNKMSDYCEEDDYDDLDIDDYYNSLNLKL